MLVVRRDAPPDLLGGLEPRRAVRWGPRLIDYQKRHGASRAKYRVFNAAVYRLYRSNVAPPEPGDTPYATSVSLPTTPANTFADGTWYLSVSKFNGVLDSGFLPLGPQGETYVKLVIVAGVAQAAEPSKPILVSTELLDGGVVRVTALYVAAADGTSRADTWAIAYTTDGSTPTAGSPTVTAAMSGTSGLEILQYELPAQADGTTVKALVQSRLSTTYSEAPPDVAQLVSTQGPASVLDVQASPGGGIN
jgi:hypothetical protein